MTITWKHLFLFWLGGALAVAAKPQRIAGFATLPEGDQLVVSYQSMGCFHYFKYTLTYSRSGDGVFALAVPEGEPPPHASRIALQPGDTQKLDALLAYYRALRPQGCTTIDLITIQQVRNGAVLATEKFTDDSCNAGRDPARLTFDQLARPQLEDRAWGEKSAGALRVTIHHPRAPKPGAHYVGAEGSASAFQLLAQAGVELQVGDRLRVSRRVSPTSEQTTDWTIPAWNPKYLSNFMLKDGDQLTLEPAKKK